MKRNALFCVLLLYVVCATGVQAQSISYGNNAAAGKFFPVRGIQMYTEQYGSGKPLLLIHGNGGNISGMASVIPFFSEHYRVIAVDSRAHGKSIDRSDSLSFEMMADDMVALLQQMKLDSAYVIGWSDGGIVALEMAMRHPSSVIRLAATGANIRPDSTALIPSLWLDEQRHYEKFKNAKRTTDKGRNDWKIFLLDWQQPNLPDAALKAIQCPALIIAGDHDLICAEHTLQIFRHISRAQLWIVPRSGHATLIEHKDDFCRTVDRFFKEK